METPTPYCTPSPSVSVRLGDAQQSVLPEEVSHKTEQALRDGKLLPVISLAREAAKPVSAKPLIIAVTGDSGNGMSSFINALRGVGHEEQASAPTGVVRTTQTPAGYSTPRFPDVELWDLPGLGVTSQSMESYVEEMRFSQYDFFIIIASEQFSTNHSKLAQTIQRMGKKFYVVWTKLDRDLSTSVLPEARLLQTIRENIQENLQKEGVQEAPIFLVCNFAPSSHDFPKLRDTLKKELPALRLSGPLEALVQLCEKVIGEEEAVLQERTKHEHFEDALGIRNADDLEEVLEAYRLRFGVDNESLHHVAQCLKKSIFEYQGVMKYPDLHTACSRNWKLKSMTCLLMRGLLGLSWYVPGMGAPVVAFFRRLQYRCILRLVVQDTKTIVRKILNDSIFPA
ncbi:immunity-related GTPase family M protein 1-like isoform X2 [Perognathus longimembris pacificus]|nr:immunity-related GTPase family M protein 1-like isoform X2 [Perognathus longimembris pacificus]